jgi:hypothetical protein
MDTATYTADQTKLHAEAALAAHLVVAAWRGQVAFFSGPTSSL